MRVFGPVVQPSTTYVIGSIADHIYRRPVRSKSIRRYEPLKYLAFLINRAPQVVDEHLVQVPTPVGI